MSMEETTTSGLVDKTACRKAIRFLSALKRPCKMFADFPPGFRAIRLIPFGKVKKSVSALFKVTTDTDCFRADKPWAKRTKALSAPPHLREDMTKVIFIVLAPAIHRNSKNGYLNMVSTRTTLYAYCSKCDYKA